MKNKKLLISLSLLTGAILIFSGITKLLDINSFIATVQADYGLGLLAIFSPLLIITELWIGVRLLLLIKTKNTALITFIFLITLSLVYTYGLIWGNAHNCGCFGGILEKYSNPTTTYIRNVVLIAFMWILKQSTLKISYNLQSPIFRIAILAATFTAGLVTTPTKIIGIAKQGLIKNTTQTEITINKNAISLTEKYKLKSQTSYLLFFYSDNCPYCLNSIENVKLFNEKKHVDSVVFVHVGHSNKRNIEFIMNYHQVDTAYRLENMQPADFHHISNIYPTALIIKNSKQYFKHKGMVPSPLTVEKKYKNVFKRLKEKQ